MPAFSRRTVHPAITLIKIAFAGLMIFTGLMLADIASAVHAAQTSDKVGRETGLPLPRFVSFKRDSVNLRAGPGRKYPIHWNYRRRYLPVEVIQEFDQWRRVRDADGTTGWVLHTLLTGKRSAIVAPWRRQNQAAKSGFSTSGNVIKASFLDGRSHAANSAAIVARLQPGLQVDIIQCDGLWCEVKAETVSFWIDQTSLWGVYPGEKVPD
ncbi:MAG: SH3 domain-containing protein [Ahrensia sp.]|nr:SH3 domain-containing protein [Ahrensia sp.]